MDEQNKIKGKGLKLYVYEKKDHSDTPFIINMEGLDGPCELPSWTSLVRYPARFKGYTTNSKGVEGVKIYFNEGYDSSQYDHYPLYPGDEYLYMYTETEISGPSDWEEGPSHSTSYLVLKKED